ncbi:ejaculatory bulb-specific protein 3-like isoform X2 [Bombus pascuorum]|nr:ejaculatory bulb-specific protein 3-like isoform X2 [Bombus pascuorum]XP_060831059.1 ejaculatory bulb-specific protein 3-like isoform X2 [Bombus pascuorum]
MHQILICLLLVIAIVYAVARPDDSTQNIFSKSITSPEKYPEKFDHINVDEILKSERLLTNYYKCLLDEGRCTTDVNEIKKIFPEALATECLKCTEKQKEIVNKVVTFLITNKPKLWDHLMNKYDPENKYRYKYEEQVKMAAAGAN